VHRDENIIPYMIEVEQDIIHFLSEIIQWKPNTIHVQFLQNCLSASNVTSERRPDNIGRVARYQSECMFVLLVYGETETFTNFFRFHT